MCFTLACSVNAVSLFLFIHTPQGSTVNMNINQKLYDHFDGVNPNYVRLGVVLFIGLGFCFASLLAGVVLGLFDKRAEIITKRKTGDGACVCVLSLSLTLSLRLKFY